MEPDNTDISPGPPLLRTSSLGDSERERTMVAEGGSHEVLVEALGKLPNGFPRTQSRVEILLLERIFSEEEAWLAGQLSRSLESAQKIAERVGLRPKDVEARLKAMAGKGQVWAETRQGKPVFRLAPFMVGIYESQRKAMDHEFAHLFERYMAEGGAAGIMKPQPALHRVVPSRGSVKSEWILPYDDVRAILSRARSFRLNECICRLEQDQVGRRCGFPTRTCLSFFRAKAPTSPTSISRKVALEMLDEFERMGLVHTVSNVRTGVGYVCNCCGCCCGILRGINDWGIEGSVAQANYYATVNRRKCRACRTCEKRCQVHAVAVENKAAKVNRHKCVGCGLCVTGCPNGAASLRRKPKSQAVEPPLRYAAWERERLAKRTLPA